jgi:hypothetical protein
MCRAEAAQERGDLAAAREHLHEAEAQLAAAGDAPGRVYALLGLGRVLRDGGEPDAAVRAVDEACDAAAKLGRPATRMVAETARAALPGGDPATARATVAEVGARAMIVMRMSAHLDLHRATGERSDLVAAADLLAGALARLSAEHRRAAAECVLLHREIADACRKAGLPPPM